ncbi:MAG: PhnD/SsuA/transferrin family substrate-binding protein [Comamonadaceae bacterium]|nr:PhnD/SsuA/transferrin family substrate-binding protein [Comamonadaceae bacterium]
MNCAGFVPFAIMGNAPGQLRLRDGDHHAPDQPALKRIEDLKGKKVAFTSETSNSGFKAPSALLQERASNWKPARTSRQSSPASTTTPCSAWRTRTTTPPPSPTR